MHNLLRGAIAGLLATVPMTLAMELLHRRLPRRQQYALPPRLIVGRVLHMLGLGHRLRGERRTGATVVSHLGYGATMGATYGVIERMLPLPGALKGVLYGLGVWAGSYLGWLPAAGILRPATEHPPQRNALMIAAHVVYGAALGVGQQQLARRF